MNFVTIKGQTYNLDQLVRYLSHVGSREIGATGEIVNPRPIFGEYRYVELIFADGSRVELDGIQSAALLRHLASLGPTLDLDQIDETALGHVLVHNTDVGDVILADEARDEPWGGEIEAGDDEPDEGPG